jgi:hypothetical protein
MATITATPCPFGVQMPAAEFASEREITEDLPSDVIGECVTEATEKAWRAGVRSSVAAVCGFGNLSVKKECVR